MGDDVGQEPAEDGSNHEDDNGFNRRDAGDHLNGHDDGERR